MPSRGSFLRGFSPSTAVGDGLAAQGVIVKAETMVRAVGGPNADVVNLGYTVFDYAAMRHADYASSS